MTPDRVTWWAESPQTELYQGDIVADLPFWTITPESIFLEKRTIATKNEGPKDCLIETNSLKADSQGFFQFLGRARFAPAIVLTHDCEFDKKRRKAPRVQLARLGDIDGLSPQERSQVMNQGSYSKLVLPNVPNLGKTLYVDFHIQITLDTRLVESKTKIASLSDFGRQRLRVGIIYYYLRKSPPPEFVEGPEGDKE